MIKYDLGFGDPILVREALCNFIDPQMAITENFLGLGYGNKSGNLTFLHYVKKLIKNFTGKEYKHNFITTGATGGINVTLRALRPMLKNLSQACSISEDDTPTIFYQTPAFHFYKEMAFHSGYRYTSKEKALVELIDSPRNPTGDTIYNNMSYRAFVIWDAAYHSPVYNKLQMHQMPNHDIIAGSFGKTTGLTGLRLGWISTDHNDYAKLIEKSLHSETLGTSQNSQNIGSLILDRLPFDDFSHLAASMIDDNREMFSKLKYLLHQDVPSNGMFYYAPISGYLEKVFKEMRVAFVPGLDLQGEPGWGRFSLAQKREVVKEFIQELRRRDG
jgi:histidinol-phosphate/aromatic aminotransferase/cobyric acid decarboxylase-like protein